MGLFSVIGGLFGGGSQKKASQKATDAMVAAFNRGIDTQNAFNQQVRQDYMPYTEAGTKAVSSLDELMTLAYGKPGAGTPIVPTSEMLDAQAQLEQRIKDSPYYDVLYRNGEEAILQNASATGGLRGGNTQRSLADFGSDTMARVYETIKNDLAGMAQLGLGAQGTVTQAGGNVTNNVTSLLGDIGTAQANNHLARGRINAQNWSNVGSFLDDAVSAFLPGGNVLASIFGKGITRSSTAGLNPAAQSVIASNPGIF